MSRWNKSKDTGPCFAMELPMAYTESQLKELNTVFRLCNDMKNRLIAFYKTQLTEMTRTRVWRENTAAISAVFKEFEDRVKATEKSGDERRLNKVLAARRKKLAPLYDVRNAQLKKYQFSRNCFEKKLNSYRTCYESHVGSMVGQCIADDVWESFRSYLFDSGKKVKFSKAEEFHSISSKTNGVNITFSLDNMTLSVGKSKHKLELKVKRNKQDRYGYEEEALSRRVRRCRIVRKAYPEGWRYFVQLTLDGCPPVKADKKTGEVLHALGKGTVGHDIGTQTLAACGSDQLCIVELAEGAQDIQKELRRINRAMDRSRRATNPAMFNKDGTVIRKNRLPADCLDKYGRRKWVKSNNYRRLEMQRRYLYRKQAACRLQKHRELANKLLAYGDVHYIEDMQFRALQKRSKETHKNKKGKNLSKKRFGKSIANKSPALFVTTLAKTLEKHGGALIHINTWDAKASQFDHMTGRYTKKKLSQRWHHLPNGVKIQRDLYSAFLIRHTNDDLKSFDRNQCDADFEVFLKLHDKEIQRLTGKKMPSSVGIAN